ncbi:MAG: nucleoside triphosphate pyrophosphohydrolase, partial [Bdellovibrionota bacterium]
MPKKKADLADVKALLKTVYDLRAPGGCPWDRAQTHQTLRPYITEEAHEVIDVIDLIDSAAALKIPSIKSAFQEELGDLLMQVVLHSELTREAGAFDFYDVVRTLNEKLIRRHPHVFGDVKVNSADTALQSWEKQKAKEKASNPSASVLDGLPKGLPALQKTARVIEKVTKVGFQWSDLNGPLGKLDEEFAELKHEVRALEACSEKSGPKFETLKHQVESELGDVLFSVCNVAYLMKINHEDALRGTLARFQSRFQYVERKL